MKAERGASLKKLIKENKYIFLLMVAVFLWLPVATIIDINKVESGQSAREHVMAPVGWIYAAAGYWPAVLFLPLCYVTFAAYIIYKFILPPRR